MFSQLTPHPKVQRSQIVLVFILLNGSFFLLPFPMLIRKLGLVTKQPKMQAPLFFCFRIGKVLTLETPSERILNKINLDRENRVCEQLLYVLLLHL